MPPQRRNLCHRYDLRSKGPVGRQICQVLDTFLNATRRSKVKPVKDPKPRTHTFTTRIKLHFVTNSRELKAQLEHATDSSSDSEPDPPCDSEMEVDEAKPLTIKQYPYNRKRLNMPDRLLVVVSETQEKVPLNAIIDEKYMPPEDDAGK